MIFSFILIVLIMLSSFFSCAETGLMAVNRYRLRHKAHLKKRYALRLLQLLKRPDRVLGAILIGNTFANMLASSLATLLAYHFLGDKGALLSVILLSLLVLIFAEIVPKTFAAIYPDKVARLVVYPIIVILKILYPLVWLVNAIGNGLLRSLHIRVGDYAAEPLSREELRSIVYDTTGKMSREYQHMLLTILDLNKMTVDDVMVPRHEIVGVDIDLPWEAIIAGINASSQDWVAFYHENVNQMVGVLPLHAMLKRMLTQPHMDKEQLRQCLREPYFVPQGTTLNIQMDYFQQSQEKVAFIVDEYGEIQGLLTLNDILEEIVGDFSAGVALSKQRIKPHLDGSFAVDGAITVREFNRSSGWELPLQGPKTINGLIVEYLEMLPHAGICVLIAGHPIEILQVKANRVKWARIAPCIRANLE
ncbi:MAG: hypothetical protein A3E85_03465 [Gammaproteobacteria bacterium RIFCSPHIGHO2_12_FULL_45_12]|nr:MAG: hypothetical protein A3E85_03465 [Gammaproteobacteria bacterium RIFCSPHIGHO2_12_FULL_45_12]